MDWIPFRIGLGMIKDAQEFVDSSLSEALMSFNFRSSVVGLRSN